MAELNKLSFKGYFIHKDGIKSYRILTVVDNDLERAFLNLLAQESENTIMVVDECDIVIKNFDSPRSLCEFYDENYDSVAGHSFTKASKFTLSILNLIVTAKEYTFEKDMNIINEKK